MSFYNLNGLVVEIKGLEDLYFHDTLRIPNWPTRQAAAQHEYHLNAAQEAGVLAAGVSLGAQSATNVTAVGGAGSTATGIAAGTAAQGLASKLTGWTHNIEQWLIRGFEMILGIGLIIVAIAKLASDTPAGRSAKKIATKAAIL